jgi:drug/metabolite transporter (DMT)-like permease
LRQINARYNQPNGGSDNNILNRRSFIRALYYALNRGGNLLQEYTHINWMPFGLGFAIVGLELGNIYMYKVGWNINTGYMLQSAIIAVALLIVGFLVFKEVITWSKLVGIAICIVGLYFINR